METWQQDRLAINKIEKITLQLGWKWREQPILDNGIDGQIEICSDDAKPTGQLFAIQSKGGESYFYRRRKDNVLTIKLQKRHLEYWNKYSLPVLVIGILPTEDRAYWLYVQGYLERNPDLLERETDSVSIEISSEDEFCVSTKPILQAIPSRHLELEKSRIVDLGKQRLDQLQRDTQSLPETHLAVAKRVLECLSQGLSGAGVKQIIDTPQGLADHGTLLLLWRLGTQSPLLMLADYVGEVYSNRLSIILTPDASLQLRAYQKDGSRVEITSDNYRPHELLVAIAVWAQPEISLWVNGKQFGPAPLRDGFDSLGPLLLFGLDIENKLSADVFRWARNGEELGLNFEKDGLGQGSCWQLGLLWERALSDEEIAHLSVDPFAMFRPRLCKSGKCPDCGSPVVIDRNRNNTEPDERIKRLDGTRATAEDFSPRPPAIWCVCTNCGRPCLSEQGQHRMKL